MFFFNNIHRVKNAYVHTEFILSLFFIIDLAPFLAIMVLSLLDFPTFLVFMGIKAYILIIIIGFLLQIVIELQILKP